MKSKILIAGLLAVLLILPVAFAEEETEEEDTSWLGELANKAVDKFFSFVLKIFNAPIKPLLSFTKKLMTSSVNTSIFKGVWSAMVYVSSIFYGIGFLYAGFNFMISGHDPIKRENAKTLLRNIIIMIVLIQASYFIYGFLLEIGSLLTSGVMEMIDNEFFMLTANNALGIGLDLLFFIPYALILLLTVILLILRYAIVAIGVALFPIGMLLHFFPQTRTYGKVIINCITINIFITFFCAIFLLAFSKIIEIPIFREMKVIVMICAFLCIDFLILFSFQIAKGDSLKGRAESAGKIAVTALKRVV